MFLPPLSHSRLSHYSYDGDNPRSHVRGKSEDCRLTEAGKTTSSPQQRFWDIRGRHSRLSSQIDPKYHYKDSGLSSISRKQATLDKRLQHYHQLKAKYESIITDRQRKSQLLKDMKSKFSVRFSRREIAESSSAQLALAALSLVNEKQKNKAAGTIAKAWRRRQWRRVKRLESLRRRVAARKIQLAWRGHMIRKKEAAVLMVRTRAALKVQQTWRGYSVRKATKEKIREIRMHKTFLYFAGVRARLLAESGHLIWRYWLRYRAMRDFFAYKERKRAKAAALKTEEPTEVLSPCKSSEIKCCDPAASQLTTTKLEEQKKTSKKERKLTSLELKSPERAGKSSSRPGAARNPLSLSVTT